MRTSVFNKSAKISFFNLFLLQCPGINANAIYSISSFYIYLWKNILSYQNDAYLYLKETTIIKIRIRILTI